MAIIKEFKEFALKGSVFDLAVGFVIGAAFNKVITSFVDNVLMPPISIVTGRAALENRFLVLSSGRAGSYETVEAAKQAGEVVLSYGKFINELLTFFLVALALFLFVRYMNKLRRLKEEQIERIRKRKKLTPERAEAEAAEKVASKK